MEFDSVNNCHCALRLETGREIRLEKLTQSRTYIGLLMGTPNKQSNDETIQSALEDAKQDNQSLGKPYLVEPERRDFWRERGDMQSVLDRQSDVPAEMRHVPEWLPQIECIGVFNSIGPVRDTTKDASSLTIVWYQDDFGFDPDAMRQLRMIDWDRHATDWEF